VKRDFFFNCECAEKYGVSGAVVLHSLVFWVYRNALNGDNTVDGKTWTYNSLTAFTTLFPFYSRDQIRRVLKNLEKDGAIETGCHNRVGFDRTKWYTITKDVADIYQMELPQHGFGKITKPKGRKRQMEVAEPPNQYQLPTTGDKPVTDQIVLPWGDDAFKEAWLDWKAERKAHKRPYKTPKAEQTALNQLYKQTNGELQHALEAINDAIAGQWQGIHVKHKPKQRGFDNRAIDLDTVHRRANSWGK